jgi:hypothetical protein
MRGEARLSLQSATVRIMFPLARALKKKETYTIVISSITKNLAPINYALSIVVVYISFEDYGLVDGGVERVAFWTSFIPVTQNGRLVSECSVADLLWLVSKQCP